MLLLPGGDYPSELRIYKAETAPGRKDRVKAYLRCPRTLESEYICNVSKRPFLGDLGSLSGLGCLLSLNFLIDDVGWKGDSDAIVGISHTLTLLVLEGEKLRTWSECDVQA